MKGFEEISVLEEQIKCLFALSSGLWFGHYTDVILIELNTRIERDLEAIRLELDFITSSPMAWTAKPLDS